MLTAPIDPILPILSRVVPVGREWIYEAKLDGFRGTLFLDGARSLFRSKMKHHMHRFQALADALARSMKVRDAILDGEIIVMGDSGPNFNALFRGWGRPQYAAFDVLWLNGKDLRALPLSKRKTILRRITKGSPIGYVEAMRDPALYDVTVQMDLEGIVAKRHRDPYGPATQWIKVRHPHYSQLVGRAAMFHQLRRR